MKIKNKKLAFSLIELSITLLIIGIMYASFSTGSKMLEASRKKAAGSLTNSSPVLATSDLVIWYETSLNSSFDLRNTNDGQSLSDFDGVSWFNNAPTKDNNASIAIGSPSYRQDAINGLPAVFFNGSSALNFDSSPFNQRYITAFIVEQRRGTTTGLLTSNRILRIDDNNFGYLDSDSITLGVDFEKSVTAFGSLQPRIITLLLGSRNPNSRGIFVNGGIGSIPAATADDNQLSAPNSIGQIGKGNTNDDSYYIGDIAEIIIYNRNLTLRERNNIQNYLGEKYNISVTDSI